MTADDIVFYFSIFVGICVVIWAYFMIYEYNRAGKN